ncbi:MAG: hypothetical protein IMZ69_04550 [Spirochaetes bacterium]|nr:hypothetical protein [Spirochaetota bacterium]
MTLNLLHAERAVTTIQYNPSTGEFVAAAPTAYPMEVRPSGQCTIGDLAQALRRHHAALAPRAYYLAALLLEQKAELPIPAQGGHVFGSFAVLVAQPMSALRQSTVEFMAFRNVLRVLYGRVSLAEILARYGDAVSRYGIGLDGACNADAALRIRLAEQERDVEAFAAEPQRPVSHTAALLTELAEAGDWPLLRDNARRYLDSPNRAVAQQARRMLALALAHFEEHADRAVAIELYQSLLAEGAAEVTDVGNLVNLLAEDGQHREARATLLRGIRMFPPSRSDYFFQIGQRLAAAAGDRAFRREIEAAMAERGQRA